ncbi:MAG TPA: hypothetical protein VMF53_13495 [Alphaproteobacteria bacterium]|nr:hypothetical protein [Alphaproteobacteria bacterium]
MQTDDAKILNHRPATQSGEAALWRYRHPEPSMRELLADPIARLLMRADRLTPREVYSALERARDAAARVEA